MLSSSTKFKRRWWQRPEGLHMNQKSTRCCSCQNEKWPFSNSYLLCTLLNNRVADVSGRSNVKHSLGAETRRKKRLRRLLLWSAITSQNPLRISLKTAVSFWCQEQIRLERCNWKLQVWFLWHWIFHRRHPCFWAVQSNAPLSGHGDNPSVSTRFLSGAHH